MASVANNTLSASPQAQALKNKTSLNPLQQLASNVYNGTNSLVKGVASSPVVQGALKTAGNILAPGLGNAGPAIQTGVQGIQNLAGTPQTPTPATGAATQPKVPTPSVPKATPQPQVAQPFNPNYSTQIQGTSQGALGTPQTQAPTPSPQNAAQQPPATYGGIIQGLYNTGTNGSKGVDDARKAIQDLQNQDATEISRIAGLPIGAGDQAGREANLNLLYSQKLGAAQTGLQNALQGQSQQISALQGAGSLAAPITPSYNQQIINPATGQPMSGGSSGSLQTAVQDVVSRINSGTMSYDDAVQQLSGYGQGGVNALLQALPQGFNTAQSNALSGQQAVVAPTIQYAQKSLESLKGSLGGLQVPGQASSIYPLNVASNLASGITGIGKGNTAQVSGLVNEARAAIQAALSSAQGGTPTDYVGQSHALLPDNPSTEQVDAAISVLNALGSIRQDIYGKPGQVQPSSQASNSLFSW